MDASLRSKFLADYKSAAQQTNKDEAIQQVYDEYKDFLLSLNAFEALSIGAELGFWSKKVTAQFN